MISAGVEGRLPYNIMTYPEPWRGPPKPEFLPPAPKPLPTTSRYNGISSSLANGTRLAPPPRSISHHQQQQQPAASPVNLTQHKDDIPEDLKYPSYATRLYQPPTFHTSAYPSPYAAVSHHMLPQTAFPPLLRQGYVQPPSLSPLETYSPPNGNSGAFIPPPAPTYSPPSSTKSSHTTLREKHKPAPLTFKVPSGKEGSLKHRILTRPEEASLLRSPLENSRKRGPPLPATVSPPQSPAKPFNNNNTISNMFTKGSLIELANGEYRKVEDMRTEDFVMSAEISVKLMLAESTVVRIEENPITGTATITLTYNQRRAQVEIESALEHPFYVFGHGWASCNAERTLQSYGLKVHPLRVGDILISLTPRDGATSKPSTAIGAPPPSTITSRQASFSSTTTTTTSKSHLVNDLIGNGSSPNNNNNINSTTYHIAPLSPNSLSKKRRWSAPDKADDEDEQRVTRKARAE